jgi:hypothetical protein
MNSRFLESTRLIDWARPQVRVLAEQLRAGDVDPIRISQRCFEWVRDEIKHTHDHGLRDHRTGVNAPFDPPIERLAFSLTAAGEADLPEIWAEPLPIVVNALRRYQNATELAKARPDVALYWSPRNHGR